MTSFHPVNTSAATDDHTMDGTQTPRANSIGVSVTSDRSSPADQSADAVGNKSSRGSGSARPSAPGHARTSSVVSEDAMNVDSEGERDGSDQETELGGAPPSKKKKGQRFFCTDFPPCNLSFTRSEHLARHIRKHTGERPFQCHCSRRFSRLDNLRQHAQTVHVNEEIPGDSLAATGTRFQRQVRTDRSEPIDLEYRVHRIHVQSSARASSTTSATHHGERPRGSSTSGLRADGEPPSTPPGQSRGLPGPSAGGSPYTPSHAYAAGPGASPQYASPMSSAATQGFWEGKTAARRLSVPSSSNPFLAQHGGTYPPPYGSPAVHHPYANAAGVFASPTSTNYPASRDESTLSAAEAEMRRRTWHPSTYPVGPTTDQPPRLPGIESFDKVVSQQRPLTPPTRKSSPMLVDNHYRAPPPHQPPPTHHFGSGYNYAAPLVRPAPPISGPGHRRGHVSWDMGLHHNLTGLDIRDRRGSRDASQWSQQTIAELQSVSSRPSSSYQPTFPPTAERSPERHRGHGANLSTSSRPAQMSPEDSSSSEGVHTPSTASVEYHPAIVHSSGYIEPHDSALPSEHPQPICGRQASHSDRYPGHADREPRTDVYSHMPPRDNGMGRLEALVAVATSENKSAARMYMLGIPSVPPSPLHPFFLPPRSRFHLKNNFNSLRLCSTVTSGLLTTPHALVSSSPSFVLARLKPVSFLFPISPQETIATTWVKGLSAIDELMTLTT
ncbi:C2H2 finger domain transcription factor dvrA [Penicillium oxalicum]|uniref:C2H2 finger domain transcription factor dvrA n=1 Tax=Penicillium oxalicum TaxID=69781 RepID=UPI0020B8B792|nr:C2H2 finger domain transcription factor dvrA [Penicillium oxalicum]KAI2792885.1 C2H2 finger domain transcription factor dvrA [Penicillium oxalicum]